MKKQGVVERRIHAILCVMVAFVCIVLCKTDVLAAGYNSDNHPSAVQSPNGTAWTIVDELPYYDSYSRKDNGYDFKFSFWSEMNTVYDTGISTNLPNPGVGQHTYFYERHGMVPVDYWMVQHQNSTCIHDFYVSEYAGITSLERNKCNLAYWSGLIPYCADCGEQVVYLLHYIKPDSAKTLQYIDIDKKYYYVCPHKDTHVNPHLEQGPQTYEHKCQSVSYNQYKVVYKHNVAVGVTGYMEPSYHMYNNATELDGVPVVPNKNLYKNTYVREGYVFDCWTTNPDGTGQKFADGAEIYNLTTEHYDEKKGGSVGVVTLYAQWKPSKSHLRIDAKGGKYDDGIGKVSGDKTTYENFPYRYKLTLDENKLTPPNGYKVSFVTNCKATINPMYSKMVFNSWKKGSPFNGKMTNETFSFLGGNNTWSVIEAVYDNGSIILPGCSNEGESLVGWYEDKNLTKRVGGPGDKYTPSKNVTLYADWEKDLVLYAENNLTVDNYKGGVDLSWEASGGTNKIFKLYQKLEGEDKSKYKPITDASNIGNSLSVNQKYEYTGVVKTYTVPYSGFYTINAYGAQGGNYGDYEGGKGGYISINVWLTGGDVISLAVGGQNGYNGGGSATAYANGGGCTSVVSKQKGVLLIAGGGGGAAAGYAGGHGGTETSLVVAGNNGANGVSGGGGGYRGGTAGDEYAHYHGEDCTKVHAHQSTECYSVSYHEHSDETCPSHMDQWCGADASYGDDNGWCENCAKFEIGGCDGSLTNSQGGKYCCEAKRWDCGIDTGAATSILVCGKSEGDFECYTCAYNDKPDGYVYDSSGAYGGSSYVQSGVVTYSDVQSGVRKGNGYVEITSSDMGYQVAFAMDGVSANDKAKPDKIAEDSVSLDDDGTGAVLISWKKPKDNGTTYNHWAQSFSIATGAHMCDSNETVNTITTEVYSYYYIYDKTPTKTVTASNKQGVVKNIGADDRSELRVQLSSSTSYLHVAAVDRAGNIGPTLNIAVEPNAEIQWKVFTNPISISSVVAGEANVYKKGGNTYYVKADNSTPFKLTYWSSLTGNASTDYQVDNLLFNVTSNDSSHEQIFTTVAEHTSTSANASVNADIVSRTASGQTSFLHDTMHSGVSRKRYAIDVTFYQSFAVPASHNGKTITVVPVAGASYEEDGWDEVKYSVWEEDVQNAIRLIPDAEAPIIVGADVLESMTDFDRDNGTTVTLSSTDLLSGVKDFKVTINNLDNLTSQTFTPNADGKIVIQFNNSNVLFYGDLNIIIEAVDNVGNKNTIAYGSSNIELSATLSKTVPNGVTTYARGEGAILDILTTGYAQYVEVIWPAEFDPSLPTSFDYSASPEFAKAEKIVFLVPSGEKSEYDITIRAYKNGMMREKVVTLQVYGDLYGRVRIR